jgi:hypothetical protein
MARRSTVALVFVLAVAAIIAAAFIALSSYTSSPASYDHVLTQYLKARASGDKDGASALTSDGFVDELADIRLRPGEFRAYDFGFQGAPTADSATLRFAVVLSGGDVEAAYLADAVFKKSGLRHVLAAIRKTATGKPIVD